MTYQSFEEIPVWQDAIQLAGLVDDFLRGIPLKEISYTKRDQIDRASLSVSNNIAEGFDRRTNKEFIQYLYIARGSASETCSIALFFKRRPYLSQYVSQITEFEELARSCSKQLRAWIKHLDNSDFQ
jgi:four helix bundle protein